MVTEKLIGVDNFLLWKNQLTSFLEINDAWKYINVEPTTPTDANEKKKLKGKLRVTLGFIKLAIGGNLIVNVVNAKIPKRVWDAIISLYETKDEAQIMSLRN